MRHFRKIDKMGSKLHGNGLFWGQCPKCPTYAHGVTTVA